MPTSQTPYLHVGVSLAQSVQALHDWLDNLAVRLEGPQCLVYNREGVRQKGLFHHMNSNVHDLFEAEIAGSSTWTTECLGNHISAIRGNSYLHVGLTAAQSVQWLYNWLDNVAGQLARPQCKFSSYPGRCQGNRIISPYEK